MAEAMPKPLPLPIERYLAAENTGDLDSLGEIFAPRATVRDEGGTHVGLDAIRKWKAGTKAKYGHRVTALASHESGGRTVVDVRLAGQFPGSPVAVAFVFALVEGKIESLEVRS